MQNVAMVGATFGAWLRHRRGTKGRPDFVSQQALADRVGVDRTHIVKIETGVIGMPDDDLRGRIHEALGTSDDDLRRAGVGVPVYLEGVVFGTSDATGELTVMPHDPTLDLIMSGARRLTPAGRVMLRKLVADLAEMEAQIEEDMRRDGP